MIGSSGGPGRRKCAASRRIRASAASRSAPARNWRRRSRNESRNMKNMKKVLALVAVITLLACSSSPAQQPSANEPAARVGDRTITLKELEDRWSAANPSEHAEAIQRVYDGRRAALDAIIAD